MQPLLQSPLFMRVCLLLCMTLGLTLAWLAILAGGYLGWQLLRQNGRILLRLDELEKRLNELEFGEGEEPAGLPVGTEAPGFELPDLAGERQSLAQFLGQPVLLVFFNPACGFCRGLAPKLAVLSRSPSLEARDGEKRPLDSKRILIISTGDPEQNRELFRQHKLSCPVLLQKQSEVATAYQANGTPSGYLIDSEGKIASALAMGAEPLLSLLEGKSQIAHPKSQIEGNGDSREGRFKERSLARSKIKRDGLKAGTPAPDFRLPRLDGRGELTLSQLRGRRVLLVFSSPNCGPCNTLAPELEKFHREQMMRKGSPSPQPSSPGEGETTSAVEVVMISKGEPKENRAKVKEHGLTFPVVLQQQWEISRRYAMFATPIAYLIDEAGVIAHDVAVGLEPILSLTIQPATSSSSSSRELSGRET